MLVPGNPLYIYKLLLTNGGFSISRIFVLIIYITKGIISFLFGLIEWLFISRKIKKTEFTAPPVYIIGHFRSGTTFLHKILVTNKRFCYISYFDVLFPYSAAVAGKRITALFEKFIHVFNIRNIFFNNCVLNLDDPGEEDLYMISTGSQYSIAWGYLFPGKVMKHFEKWTHFSNEARKERWRKAYLYFLKRVSYRYQGRPMILKNPPNIARVRHLLEIFPEARFIFIYRNPYEVYHSMQNMWKNIIEKYISLHSITEEERKHIILNYYRKEMSQCLDDLALIPEENLMYVRYDDLTANPSKVTREIYDRLDIPGYDETKESISKKINEENNYKKTIYQYQDATLDEIYKSWQFFIDKWDYSRPTDSSSQKLKQINVV